MACSPESVQASQSDKNMPLLFSIVEQESGDAICKKIPDLLECLPFYPTESIIQPGEMDKLRPAGSYLVLQLYIM